MEDRNFYAEEIEKIRQVLRSFYMILDSLNQCTLTKETGVDHYLGTFVKIDEKLYPTESESDKLAGFQVFEGISRIYYITGYNEETLENVIIANLETEKEIEFYLDPIWELDDAKIVRRIIENKCKEILIKILEG